MARASRVLLTLVTLWGFLFRGSPAGFALAADEIDFGSTRAWSAPGQFGWRYDPASKQFVEKGTTRGSLDAPGGPKYEYVLSERCAENSICGASAYTCPRGGASPGIRYRALAFMLTPANQRIYPPVGEASVCQYPGRSVPLVVVEAAVREEIRRRIPSPLVVSSPPGRSVVNLFTIFSTVPAAEQAITFTTPVPGEVRAVPEYVWDFGDGLTGVGPGKPFDSGVLPSKNKGYYLGATYAKPGSKHVTVTVTWRVTFRLEGVTSVPLAPIVMTASEDKPIATARAVLVR